MKFGPEHIGKQVRRVGIVPVEGILSHISNFYGFYNLKSDPLNYIQDDEKNGIWELVDEEPQGLSLLEAMQSGKKFREIGTEHWFQLSYYEVVAVSDHNNRLLLNPSNLTARYELKPEHKPESKKVEITADQIRKIWNEILADNSSFLDDETLITKLGLE